MSLQSATGDSENIDEAYAAGLEIGDMVLEKIELKAHFIGLLFCNIDFDFAALLRGASEKLGIPMIGGTNEWQMK